jgi:ribosomal protein L32
MLYVYVVVWLICGFAAAAIYSNKGRSGAAAFIVGVLFGPIGVLLALLSSRDTAAVERKALTEGAIKKCPYCGELVRREAVVCKHCGRDIPATVYNVPEGHAAILPGATAGLWHCSACGGLVRRESTVCKHCKKPLALPMPPASPPTA